MTTPIDQSREPDMNDEEALRKTIYEKLPQLSPIVTTPSSDSKASADQIITSAPTMSPDSPEAHLIDAREPAIFKSPSSPISLSGTSTPSIPSSPIAEQMPSSPRLAGPPVILMPKPKIKFTPKTEKRISDQSQASVASVASVASQRSTSSTLFDPSNQQSIYGSVPSADVVTNTNAPPSPSQNTADNTPSNNNTGAKTAALQTKELQTEQAHDEAVKSSSGGSINSSNSDNTKPHDTSVSPKRPPPPPPLQLAGDRRKSITATTESTNTPTRDDGGSITPASTPTCANVANSPVTEAKSPVQKNRPESPQSQTTKRKGLLGGLLFKQNSAPSQLTTAPSPQANANSNANANANANANQSNDTSSQQQHQIHGKSKLKGKIIGMLFASHKPADSQSKQQRPGDNSKEQQDKQQQQQQQQQQLLLQKRQQEQQLIDQLMSQHRNIPITPLSIFGGRLDQQSRKQRRIIPRIVQECARIVEERGSSQSQIYRTTGPQPSIQRLRFFYNTYDNFWIDPNYDEWSDVNVVAGALKLYLSELEEPVVDYEKYKLQLEQYFITASTSDETTATSDAERVKYMRQLVRELSPPHGATLAFLTRHMARMTAKQSQLNVTVTLPTVFGPLLIRYKKQSQDNSSNISNSYNTTVVVAAVEFLVKHVEDIFT